MLPLANKQYFSINQADLQPTHFHPYPYLGQSLEKQLHSAIWAGWKGYRERRSTAYWWHWSQNLPHFPLLLFMVIVLWCVQCFTGKTKDRILERERVVFFHTHWKSRGMIIITNQTCASNLFFKILWDIGGWGEMNILTSQPIYPIR